MELATLTSPNSRTIYFSHQSVVELLQFFPIVPHIAPKLTISLYGIVRQNGRILLQGDYSQYLKKGTEGIPLADGRVAFPFLAVEFIPESERRHNEFCFVYNMFSADGKLLGHRRCDSTLKLERRMPENSLPIDARPTLVPEERLLKPIKPPILQ